MSQKVKNKVDIELVKKLRQETGGGVMDCRAALLKAKGDYEKAKKILAAEGIKKATKKQGRETKQGYVATYTHATGRVGAMVEVLCETDFVARNREFQQFARELCLQIAAMNPKNEKELLRQAYIREPEKTVEEFLKSQIAKFGENIRIGRFQRLEV